MNVSWRAGGVWQPTETVFVGDVPLQGWRDYRIDFSGVVPPSAEKVRVTFAPDFGDGLLEVFALDDVAVGRFDAAVAAPPSRAGTGLLGVHPNPANPRATVVFHLEEASLVELTVYDFRGRKVRTLVEGMMESGRHEELFDGRDARGNTMASGTYIVRLETPTEFFAERITLVK